MDQASKISSVPEASERDGHSVKEDMRFIIVLIFLSVILAYFLLIYGKTFFHWVSDNLPLLMPLAVTVLSIFTRAADIRNYESVLKISNDIAIGIISFDIWAISAQSGNHGNVLVNAMKMIDGGFVIPLLLAGLLVSVGCVVLTHYKFSSTVLRQRFLLIGFIVSIMVYVMPFGILQPIEHRVTNTRSINKYTVIIPYEDPGVTRLAPTVLRDRLFVQFERDIDAVTPLAAQEAAVQQFLASDTSDLYRRDKRDDEGKVVVRKSRILVVDQRNSALTNQLVTVE